MTREASIQRLRLDLESVVQSETRLEQRVLDLMSKGEWVDAELWQHVLEQRRDMRDRLHTELVRAAGRPMPMTYSAESFNVPLP